MKQLHLPTPTAELLIGMVATATIALALLLYALWEPARIASAQARQLSTDLDQGMTFYAKNCVVCHGSAGTGSGANPPLATAGMRTADFDTLAKVIARGRTGTAMPAWSQEDAGPLSNYQIGQVVTLIQTGDWQATADRVADLGLEPPLTIRSAADATALSQVRNLANGDQMAQALPLFATNCVACHGADGTGTALAPGFNTPAVQVKEAAVIERTIANGVPGTLMSGWSGVLAPEEITLLAAFVKGWAQLPAGAVVAPAVPIPVTAASLALGAGLYAGSCTTCHGADGQGTPRAPSLNVKSFLTATNDAAMQQIITMGVPGTAMPAWGDRLSETEIQALVGFIRAWEPNAPAAATPAWGPGWQLAGSSNMTTGSSGSTTTGPPWLRRPTW